MNADDDEEKEADGDSRIAVPESAVLAVTVDEVSSEDEDAEEAMMAE